MIFKTKPADVFKERHNGPTKQQMQEMLQKSDQLILRASVDGGC